MRLSLPLVLLLSLCVLYGCATITPKPSASASVVRPAAKPVDLALLAAGMTIASVGRLEPPPEQVFTMASAEMTVVKWVYEGRGRPVALYFANGVLQSWTP